MTGARTCAFGHYVREIIGSEGCVFVDEAGGVLSARSRFPQDFRERFADAYRNELAAFVHACRGRVRRRGPSRNPCSREEISANPAKPTR